MNKQLILSLVILASFLSANSIAEERNVFFDVGAALAFGGDELIEFKVENEDGDRSTLSVEGGTGYMAHAGMLLRFYDTPIDILTTLGYHVGDTSAKGASASFKRTRWDFIPAIRIKENHRVGLGISHHTGVEFKYRFYDVKEEVDYKDATGIQVAYDYLFLNNRMSVGGRYTDIEYEPEVEYQDGYRFKTIDGSHIAVVFNYAI